MLKQRIIPTCIKEMYERKNKIYREEERTNEPEGQENQNNEMPINDPVNPDLDTSPSDNTTAPSQPNQPQPAQPIAPTEPTDITNPANFVYSSNEPYPEIENASPSLYEVKLIKWQVSSRNSEFSAINTYLYQYFILQDEYPEIATALKEISEVEMKHFDLLSEAIVDFGGNPNLTDGRGNVWTGRNITQLKNPREILLSNIKAEEKAIKDYQIATSKTFNPSLAALFERIILDEQNHIMIFNELLKTLP